jgi:hypothetical protein
MPLIYQLSQLHNKMEYDDAKKIFSNYQPIHLGQLKLFFTELYFLTKCSEPGDTVLYIGAAPGYHTNKLIEMFPDLTWHLYDPRKFEIQPSDKVKIHNQFFTDKDAQNYSDKSNLLFMSDIRNQEIARNLHKSMTKEEQKAVDNIVDEDMIRQKRWVEIMKPKYSYLKFRLPYLKREYSYLDGTIYLQPYSPMATETRLLVDKLNVIDYDSFDYDQKIAYFNACIRFTTKYDKYRDVMEKYDIKNCWDNVLALHITRFYLKKFKNDSNPESMIKLFIDIVDYHSDHYGEKYDIIFREKIDSDN